MENNFSKNTAVVKMKPWIIVLSTLVSIFIMLPFIIVFSIIFFVYKHVVMFLLKMKHGSDFDGFPEGIDINHLLEDSTKLAINSIATLEYNFQTEPKLNLEPVFNLFCKEYIEEADAIPKFHAVYKKFMGYYYRVKTKVSAEESIRYMNVVGLEEDGLSKEEFHNLMNHHFNSPLPRDGTVLFEALFGRQHLKWLEDPREPHKKFYPAMMRVHHTVADGVSLIKFLLSSFGDAPINKLSNSPRESNGKAVSWKQSPKNSFLNRIKNVLNNVKTAICIWAMAPALLFIMLGLQDNDRNILYGAPLSGKRNAVFLLEESQGYVEKIRRIRKKIPGSTFSEIIFTAFSASFADYYRKRTDTPPEYITCVVPATPGSDELRNIIPQQYKKSSLKFRNIYSLINPSIPISPKYEGNTPLLNRYKWVNESVSAIRNSYYYHVTFFGTAIFAPLLPAFLAEFVQKMVNCTALISIIAGPDEKIYVKKHWMKHFLFWVPTCQKIGITFASNTFNKRLHLTLNVDKVHVPETEDAEKILEDVFKYIDLFEKELETVCEL